MKNLLIPFIMFCLSILGLQAQNQTKESPKNQVIVKKITIQNIDGKETRTESTETFDAASWNEKSLNDKDIEVIIKDKDDVEVLPEAGENSIVIDPDQFITQMNEAQAEDNVAVSPPNKAVLGVQLSNVDGDNGAQILEVFEGSAAGKAGLLEGDILLSVNGKETSNVDAVIKALSENKPGDKVKVTYLRGTKIKNIKATLQERKEEMMSMKKCSPSCMAKMRSCKPGEMAKCMKNSMGINNKVREQIEKEIERQGVGKNGESKKIIIIKKNPGEVRILRNKKTGDNEMEIRTKDKIDLEVKEEIARSDGKQSLNVEYLTSSPNPSNGQMKIKFAGLAVPTTIQVMDLNGKEVYNEKIENFDGTYNKDIDIHNEAKGTLILKIIQGDKVMTQKIIVE